MKIKRCSKTKCNNKDDPMGVIYCGREICSKCYDRISKEKEITIGWKQKTNI